MLVVGVGLLLFTLGSVLFVQTNVLIDANNHAYVPAELFDFEHNLEPIHRTLLNTFVIKLENCNSNERNQKKDYVRKSIDNFSTELAGLKIKYQIIYIYIHVFQGFALTLLDPKDVGLLERLESPKITAIVSDSVSYSCQGMPQMEIHDYPHSAMRIPHFPLRSHFLGEGLKAGVIDQGIPFTDPAFKKPNQTCNKLGDAGCRVKQVEMVSNFHEDRTGNKGRIFQNFVTPKVANFRAERKTLYRPGYIEGTMLTGSHGIKVSSLLGGTAPGAPGIATEVALYDYRVIDSKSECMLTTGYAALELAIEDNMDVICMSFGLLGAYFLGPLGPFRKSDQTEIFISAAVGNAGRTNAPFMISDNASPQHIMGVGFYRIPYRESFTLALVFANPKIELKEIPFTSMRKDSFYKVLGEQRVRLVILSEDGSVRKISLVKRRTPNMVIGVFIIIVCSDLESCRRLSRREIILGLSPQAIFFHSPVNLRTLDMQQYTVPIGCIEGVHEEFMAVSRYRLSSVFIIPLYLRDSQRGLAPDPGSSFGPSFESMAIKPDICLPGGNILTYQGVEPYTSNSPASHQHAVYVFSAGSSFSGGTMAGIAVAYLSNCKKNNATCTFQAFLGKVQTTAIPYVYFSEDRYPSIKGYAASVLQQGAGLLQMDALLHTQVTLNPSKLELPPVIPQDKVAYYTMGSLTIQNDGENTVIYSIQHVPSLSLYYDEMKHRLKYEMHTLRLRYFFEGLNQLGHLNTTISIPPGRNVSMSIMMKFEAPRTPHLFFNGYIQFVPLRESRGGQTFPYPRPKEGYGVLNAPYLLFYGDIEKFPIVVSCGSKEAYLTDLRVLKYRKNYMDIQKENAFPKYRRAILDQGEVPYIPLFLLSGYAKPVLSLCLTMPVESMWFHLYRSLTMEWLGYISHAKALSVKCHLFLHFRAVLSGGGDNGEDDTDIDASGWKGTYRDSDHALKTASTGLYRICAEVRQKPGGKGRFVWCSIPFFIEESLPPTP